MCKKKKQVEEVKDEFTLQRPTQAIVDSNGNEDYFSEYYNLYKNDYINQYLNAFQCFKKSVQKKDQDNK